MFLWSHCVADLEKSQSPFISGYPMITSSRQPHNLQGVSGVLLDANVATSSVGQGSYSAGQGSPPANR